LNSQGPEDGRLDDAGLGQLLAELVITPHPAVSTKTLYTRVSGR